MTKPKRILLIISLIIAVIIITPFLSITYLYLKADMKQPNISVNKQEYIVKNMSGYYKCNNSLLRKNEYGLWEIYLEGNAKERGATLGAIAQDLMKYQEDVFINQIREIIPSDSYLSFLRYLLIAFNRNLGSYIPDEFREEIYSASVFCTNEYNKIGTPYERQLNYHAAHDIGHTMQQYMLVGCSSFGVWSNNSADSTFIIGRNFDFYVGDDFAKNKLISFYNPDNGYKFVSVGWPGMIGVVSGINEKGLSVTINAAKGDIPTSAATPISILTREILQYSSNIEQAYNIAKKYRTFVSESILIGSASDSIAAIIEKTPNTTQLYTNSSKEIICTNHFQSSYFKEDKHNLDNIANSDSKYRWERLNQLLDLNEPIDYTKAITILRDQKGINGEDIGLANEKSLNQSIAHHSVLFDIYKLRMWVTTSKWLGGEYICYDLKDIFNKMDNNNLESSFQLLNKPELIINRDSSYIINDYPRVISFRNYVKDINRSIKYNETLNQSYIDNFISINPGHYLTWKIIGDYFKSINEIENSKKFYSHALECEIPYKSTELEIEKLINSK